MYVYTGFNKRIHTYIYMYMYIHMYVPRKREREKERELELSGRLTRFRRLEFRVQLGLVNGGQNMRKNPDVVLRRVPLPFKHEDVGAV